MIALFYEGHTNPNGALSYIEHLATMLERADHTVNVYKIRKVHRTMPLYRGSKREIHLVTRKEAVAIADEHPSLIMQVPDEPDETYAELLDMGLSFVIHGGPGAKDKQLRSWIDDNAKTNPVVVSGEALKVAAEDDGYTDVVVIPLPYVRHFQEFQSDFRHNAVAIGRVSSEKRTDMICEANTLLPKEKRIKICGVISGQMFEYHKLRKHWPNWKDDYIDSPQAAGMISAEVCWEHSKGVDMTEFSWDGGRAQYVTLEMFDAGCAVIVNREWVSYPGEMQPDINCYAAGSAEELAELASADLTPNHSSYLDVLHMHSAEAVLPKFLDVICICTRPRPCCRSSWM